MHSLRVLLFVLVLALIRNAHRQTEFVDRELASNSIANEFVAQTFSIGARLGEFAGPVGNLVVDDQGTELGYVLQTSPDSDSIIGYSGPTNCLIAIDLNNKIQAVSILNSRDTIDHVASVKESADFWNSFRGLEYESWEQFRDIDAVSGATLTSYSVIASVANRMGTKRLGGEPPPSLKFQQQPNIDNVKKLFASGKRIQTGERPAMWNVLDENDELLGSILSTTPAADHLSGYQGPTATLIGFDRVGECVGLAVDQSYENEPYANYLDDDYGFQAIYQGKPIDELAAMDPAKLGIEGVSGATMTSLAVVEGLPLAAALATPALSTAETQQSGSANKAIGMTRSLTSYAADGMTILLTMIGVAFSFTKLSRLRWLRIGFQITLIVMLGFFNGHILSQASISGWSANSVPWTVAPGLVFLSFAAFLIPICSKHQPYCQHICPFGAIQQLMGNRIRKRTRWKLKISKATGRFLSIVPYALLLLAVFVAISRSTFNLASIEPFDGFAFRVAGWTTISIFIAGIVASMFSPMAYCRFGCPTGAAINFLRFRADSHQLGTRDLAAVALVLLALFITFAGSTVQ